MINAWECTDQCVRVHHHSKGHILTPTLKAFWQTRAERLLQWHSEDGHENILFTDEKIFTIKEQYKHQNNKIYAQMFHEVKENVPRLQGSHYPFCVIGGRCPIRGWHIFIFARKGVKLVSEFVKRTCYKELWAILTWPSSVVRNGSSSRTQFLPKGPRQLRSDCEGIFWPSSAPRIGFWRVPTSNPWTINCGLFWRTWHAGSVTTAWRAWVDPLWRQRQRSSGDGDCAATAEWMECLKACVKA